MTAIIQFLLYAVLSYLSNAYQTRTPTRFSVAPETLAGVITSSVQFVFRMGSGAFVSGYSVGIDEENEKEYTILSTLGYRIKENPKVAFTKRPKQFLELYEFEGCPFCRKVREAVTLLDLDVLFYPCPKGGPNYRQKVKQIGGKEQFPYLIDPNTGVSMYESADIIQYLFDTYGTGEEIPSALDSTFLNTMSLTLAMIPTWPRGSGFEESKQPEEPLVFWGYESSPFCKIVRQRLVELEIPHIQKTCGRGSAKRNELFQKTGRFLVPYLEDPNTGVSLFESADILKYLNEKYAVAANM